MFLDCVYKLPPDSRLYVSVTSGYRILGLLGLNQGCTEVTEVAIYFNVTIISTLNSWGSDHTQIYDHEWSIQMGFVFWFLTLLSWSDRQL